MEKRTLCLEQLVFKRHVGFGLETDAGTEDVGESTTLLGKGVDNWGASWDERSLRTKLLDMDVMKGEATVRTYLEHVAQNAEHAMEALVITSLFRLPLNASHHLGHKDEIDDQW